MKSILQKVLENLLKITNSLQTSCCPILDEGPWGACPTTPPLHVEMAALCTEKLSEKEKNTLFIHFSFVKLSV